MPAPQFHFAFGLLCGIIIVAIAYRVTKKQSLLMLAPFIATLCGFLSMAPDFFSFLENYPSLTLGLSLSKGISHSWPMNIFFLHPFLDSLAREGATIGFAMTVVIYNAIFLFYLLHFFGQKKKPVRKWAIALLFLSILALGGLFYEFSKLPEQKDVQAAYQEYYARHYEARPDLKEFKGNLHTHTTWSGEAARHSYDEMVEEAIRLGFDFLAITDYSKISNEAMEKCLGETRLLCIPGEEVGTKQGDILAIGINKTIKPGLEASEAIELIHEAGGIAIAAHPTGSDGLNANKLWAIKDSIDAMECFNAKHWLDMDEAAAMDISAELDIPCVFDSDAHSKEVLGDQFNICQMVELNQENLLEAIKSGNCKKGK